MSLAFGQTSCNLRPAGGLGSLGISPVSCATQYCRLLSQTDLSRNKRRPVTDSAEAGSL